jgi:hypothetical protein
MTKRRKTSEAGRAASLALNRLRMERTTKESRRDSARRAALARWARHKKGRAA